MNLEELQNKLIRCLANWRAYEKDLTRAGLSGPLKATAVGWKVADQKTFIKAQIDLLPISTQAHVGTVNDRFIGSFLLKEPLSKDEIPIIKVLQLRPSSNDPLGLDHVDFYCHDIDAAKEVLTKTSANWQAELNEVHAWLSVRFGEDLEYEAKLVDHTVLEAAITELKQVQAEILKQP